LETVEDLTSLTDQVLSDMVEVSSLHSKI
jgi:hypothetical protein